MRFLGRTSDIINVGGSKVYPAEVEGVLASMSNIAEVAVHGEPNAPLGNIVCARVRLVEPEDPKLCSSVSSVTAWGDSSRTRFR